MEEAKRIEVSWNPLEAFVDEGCKLGTGLGVPKDELYSHYQLWCMKQGINSLSKQAFSQKLLNGRFRSGLGTCKPRNEKGKQIHSFSGISTVFFNA